MLANGPDGRDLAPRLAHLLDRPLLAGAVAVRDDGATVARHGGLLMEDVVVDGPFVATLQPGVRGVERRPALVRAVERRAARRRSSPPTRHRVADADVLEVHPARPGHHGPGRGAPHRRRRRRARLQGGHGPARPAWPTRLGCSTGGTRVITDWGWLPFERQIGTTGVTVHPELYLAFGISGAVQHVAGLGDPAHVISVNTDASCPMMSLADLALVTDAPALVAELARRLDRPPRSARRLTDR